jgi:molecular chaperone DnaK (HSP70)
MRENEIERMKKRERENERECGRKNKGERMRENEVERMIERMRDSVKKLPLKLNDTAESVFFCMYFRHARSMWVPR